MALKDVQLFVTKYLRDADLRESVSRNGIKELALEYGLNEAEQETLAEMDLSFLENEAKGIVGERMEKREGEFKEFFDHLSKYVSTEQFFNQFDQAYRTGLMTRPVELDCFLSFATDYVVQNNLPPYLVDLARFNYHYTQVSITPIENGEKTKEADEELKLYHLVQLKVPHRVVNFRYDILSILRSEFNYNNPLYYQENLISLFIQKDWSKATTTQIFYTNEIAFLDQLLKGEISVNELLVYYSVQHYEWVINTLIGLYQKNIISVKLPKHFL